MEFRSTTGLQADTGDDAEGSLRVREVSPSPSTPPGRAALILTCGGSGISRKGTTKPFTVLLDVALTPQEG